MNSINSPTTNPTNYRSFRSSSKVQESADDRAELPWSCRKCPGPHRTATCHRMHACKQLRLHPGYHLLLILLLLLSFFLFEADKSYQVFPSHLDTKIKSLPNFWLLSSYARVSEPAPESCSRKPGWGEVVFISGTRFSFLETKHSSIGK